jgi:hypothetical protein
MRYVHGHVRVPERRTDAEWASYLTEERPGVPVEPGKGHIRNIDTPFHTRLGLKMASASIFNAYPQFTGASGLHGEL